MPDAALFDDADGGGLRTAAELRAQATRLLADPRAASLVESFAAQWLSLPGLEQHEVDAKQFTFDKAFASAIRSETLAFFGEFLANGLPVQDLLRAPFTFINDRLATHYGLPPVGSANPSRVMLAGDTAPGAAHPGGDLDPHLVSGAHLADGARGLDLHPPALLAAAASAGQRPRLAGAGRQRRRRPCASVWRPTAPTRPAPPATP